MTHTTHYTGLYFLVEWQEQEGNDEEPLFDVLPSKSVGYDVLDISEGACAEANFGGKWYPVKIIGKGMTFMQY